MLTPTFHFNILDRFLGSMNEQANIMVDIISSRIDHSQLDNTVIDVVPVLTACTLDIICGKS